METAVPVSCAPSGGEAHDSPAMRWARTQKFERILVPTDFSGNSLRALSYAIPLAGQCKGTLVLLHVVGPASYLEELTYVGVREVSKCNLATRRINALKAADSLAGVSVECRIETGIVFDKIVEVAAETKADLIVLAGHDYSTLEHAATGATVERVVRHAPCPVYVIRGSIVDSAVGAVSLGAKETGSISPSNCGTPRP